MPPSAETLVVAVEPTADAKPGCDMCSHPLEAHDSIATRYCAASASSALSRGCVCKVPVAVG
jgi:hypothetical protein